MNPALVTALLSIPLLVPATPAAFLGATRTTTPFDAQALRALDAPGLEGLRAGRAEAPALLEHGERAGLQQAHAAGADLAEMRAAGLSNREWTWVAVGALVIIILLVI
ncbi:MAG TPA: hypothetical protein VMT18_09655 [Planctomycetota bacterium]|nr:hypothetical protein [Planctomycetota bacterium]